MKTNPPIINEYTYGKPSPYRTNPFKKDVLFTEEGQWAYPGQVTKIPSGDITMQGVPYPVLGVDNYGNQQMMQPGAHYTFPGQYVTEYPQVAYGGDPSLPDIEGHYQDGGNYNMQRALELGYKPDETEHWPSVDSETGMWLKSKKHPTAWMEYMYGQLDPELAKAYSVRVNPEGYFGDDQLQYVPKKPFGGQNTKTHTHMEEGGGWLDEEFKRGGSKMMSYPKLRRGAREYGTSKNIQSSVNDMFVRNKTLFGSSSKGIYNYKSKFQEGGGWLDEYQNAGSTGVRQPYIIPPKDLEVAQRHAQGKWTDAEAEAWAKKAEAESTAQAKKEHINEFIQESTKDAMLNSPFNFVASFTPLGAPIFAAQSAASALQSAGEGNLKEAGINAAFALPLLSPIKRLKALKGLKKGPNAVAKEVKVVDDGLKELEGVTDWHNWESKYKGKNIAVDEAGKKVGAFNEGVFEINGHPGFVGKIEDISAHGKDATTVGEMYPHLDIAGLHKGVNSKHIAKVVQQLPHPEDLTKRILIAKKVEGTPWSKLTPREFAKIPNEAHLQLDADMRHLRNNGLAIDFMGENILYNPKEKAFKILDVSPTRTTMGETMTENWHKRIIKGVDQGLPNSQSSKLMRDAYMNKYKDTHSQTLDKFQAKAHGFEDIPNARNTIDMMQIQSTMDSNPLSYWQDLYLKKAEEIGKRKRMELIRLLAKQPVDKMGGQWLDNLT